MPAKNKIKYGIRSAFYAVATDDGTGTLTYGTPVAWPGAVSLSLDQQGEQTPFYADDVVYFTSSANNGYQGDFETALIPDSFRTDVLGEELDADNGIYVERANVTPKEFALLFEFQGDVNATRHVLYRCVASRPAVNGSTKEDSIEPQTETIQITAMPRINDEVVKARCPYGADAYSAWFSAVVEPSAGE